MHGTTTDLSGFRRRVFQVRINPHESLSGGYFLLVKGTQCSQLGGEVQRSMRTSSQVFQQGRIDLCRISVLGPHGDGRLTTTTAFWPWTLRMRLRIARLLPDSDTPTSPSSFNMMASASTADSQPRLATNWIPTEERPSKDENSTPDPLPSFGQTASGTRQLRARGLGSTGPTPA